ncbi:MAG: long-chain fatty acid--CoA ligase, partial [Planctomycetes bacterium]|nr:long-chain fatty acid--CoA ligase [Planctomycetota bacterium]
AVALFAVYSAGMAAFPLHPNLTKAELLTAARRSSAVVIIGTGTGTGAGEVIAALDSMGVARIACDPVSEVRAESPLAPAPRASSDESPVPREWSATASLLLQSSGTTGPPKIVRRSAAAIDAVAVNVANCVGLSPSDRVLGVIPVCHAYGIENCLMSPLLAGSAVHLSNGFDVPLVMEQVTRSGITVLPGTAFLFEMLAQRAEKPARVPDLRCAYSAGSQLPRSVFDAFHDRFGVPIGQLYGMTEVGSITFNDPGADGFDPESCGPGMAGVTFRIVDPATQRVDQPLPADTEGEVAVRASSMLCEYVDDDASPFVDGFVMTGDLGRLGARGHLTITGRLKLLIDVGASKVNPIEVEQTLAGHRAVKEAIIVPVRVTDTLVRLKAVVVRALDPATGRAVHVEPDELRRYVRERLSLHKVPRLIEFRDSLPRTASGKVMRASLQS